MEKGPTSPLTGYEGHTPLYVSLRAKYGRGNRIRTCDFLVPNQALYQTELLPVFGCTPDLSGGVEKAGNIGYPPAKGNPIFQDTRD